MVHQCNKPSQKTIFSAYEDVLTPAASASVAKFQNNRQAWKNKPKYSLKKTFGSLKNTRSYSRCHKCRHWYNDHNEDGSLPSAAVCSDAPLASHADPASSSEQRGTPAVPFSLTSLHYPSTSAAPPEDVRPMDDNRVPYSASSISELCRLRHATPPHWRGKLEPVLTNFAHCRRWQYGCDSHASETRDIIGSVLIVASLRNNN